MSDPLKTPTEEIADIWVEILSDGRNSNLEPASAFEERTHKKITENLNLQREQIQRGYQIILVGLEKSGENTEAYKITAERLKSLEDFNDVKNQFNLGKTYQDLLGYTDQMMISMYEIARSRFAEKNYEEAICVLKFLTTLTPLISIFWTSLGNAYELNEQITEALSAYEVPIVLDPTKIEHYVQAAKCSIAVNDSDDQAIQIFEGAKEFAHSEHLPELEKSADKYLQNINNQNKQRRVP